MRMKLSVLVAVAVGCGWYSAFADATLPTWRLTLVPAREGTAQPVKVCGADQRCAIETLPDGVRRLTYGALVDGDSRWKVKVVLDERVTPDEKAYSGRIENHEDGLVVTAFEGPFFDRVPTDPKATRFYFPEGFGRRVTLFPKSLKGLKPVPELNMEQRGAPCRWYAGAAGEAVLTGTFYPSKGVSLPLLVADLPGGRCLYAAVHDPANRTLRPVLRYAIAGRTSSVAFDHRFFLRAGKAWDLAETVFAIRPGDWHAAARRYRSWYDGVRKIGACSPDWAKKTTGQLLVIMKQQNEDLFWSYTDIPKLCDVAEANGLDTIGLFGWTKGGHDHLYPDYDPDPKMGGVEALKAGIAEAHRRGLRVYIYANGMLQQVGATGYWEKFGRFNSIVDEKGDLCILHYHKYSYLPRYDFAVACLWTKPWRERMGSFAHQAASFGADGILYDQLGVLAPRPCWGEGHGHDGPAFSHETERPRFLRSIADEMRTGNPDFAVLTEGLHDTLLDSIALFHSTHYGSFAPEAADAAKRVKGKTDGAFPEFFRYLFPELVATTRNPTPMATRSYVNYAATFGLRNEIELRYAPDRAWALDAKVPTVESYGSVTGKPNLEWMRSHDPRAAAAYLKAVCLLQREHSKYLLEGRFADDEGFSAPMGDVIAKRFVAADGTSAVVVWNPGDRQVPVRIDGLGAVKAAFEPEAGKVAPETALAANSLRLYAYDR